MLGTPRQPLRPWREDGGTDTCLPASRPHDLAGAIPSLPHDLVADLMPGLKRCILADPKGVIGLAKPEAARGHEIIVRRAVVFLRNLQNEPMIPLEQLLLGAIAPGFRQAKQILHLAGIRNRTTPAISS
jgi:hypothetical protein